MKVRRFFVATTLILFLAGAVPAIGAPRQTDGNDPKVTIVKVLKKLKSLFGISILEEWPIPPRP